jgi:hypothetical protein
MLNPSTDLPLRRCATTTSRRNPRQPRGEQRKPVRLDHAPDGAHGGPRCALARLRRLADDRGEEPRRVLRALDECMRLGTQESGGRDQHMHQDGGYVGLAGWGNGPDDAPAWPDSARGSSVGHGAAQPCGAPSGPGVFPSGARGPPPGGGSGFRWALAWWRRAKSSGSRGASGTPPRDSEVVEQLADVAIRAVHVQALNPKRKITQAAKRWATDS